MEYPDEKISYFAGIVFEVAKVKPYKSKRLKVSVRECSDLLEKMNEIGSIVAYYRC